MSCDWDVWCLDCEDGHGFADANHQRGLMVALAKMGPQLGAFAPTMRELQAIGFSTDARLELQFCLSLCFDWFEKHATHRLIARDEYGHNDDECGIYFVCASCKHQKCCRRFKEHDGDHDAVRDPVPA